MIDIQGYAMFFDKANCLGHLYPSYMAKEIGDALKRKIEEERLIGECPRSDTSYKMFPENASHKVTDIVFDERTNALKCKCQVLDTPAGQKVQDILRAGLPLYFLPRLSVGHFDSSSGVAMDIEPITIDIDCSSLWGKDCKVRYLNAVHLSDDDDDNGLPTEEDCEEEKEEEEEEMCIEDRLASVEERLSDIGIALEVLDSKADEILKKIKEMANDYKG